MFNRAQTQFYAKLRPRNTVFEAETCLNYAKTNEN